MVNACPAPPRKMVSPAPRHDTGEDIASKISRPRENHLVRTRSRTRSHSFASQRSATEPNPISRLDSLCSLFPTSDIYMHIPRSRNATMITRCLKRHHDTMKATCQEPKRHRRCYKKREDAQRKTKHSDSLYQEARGCPMPHPDSGCNTQILDTPIRI